MVKAKHIKNANKWLLQGLLDPAWNPEAQEVLTAITHAAVENPKTLLRIIVWSTTPVNVVQTDNSMRVAGMYAMMFPEIASYNIGLFIDNHCMLALVAMQTYSHAAKHALKEMTNGVTTLIRHTLPKADGLSTGTLLKRIIMAPELKNVTVV